MYKLYWQTIFFTPYMPLQRPWTCSTKSINLKSQNTPLFLPTIQLAEFLHLALLMPPAETIKEFDSFIPRVVDLVDHTSIFLLRTINHYVTFIICTLSWFVPTGTSSEFFPPEYPPRWDIPDYLGPDLTLRWFWSMNSSEPTNPTRSCNALLGYRVL